jgi:hypothetical protein
MNLLLDRVIVAAGIPPVNAARSMLIDVINLIFGFPKVGAAATARQHPRMANWMWTVAEWVSKPKGPNQVEPAVKKGGSARTATSKDQPSAHQLAQRIERKHLFPEKEADPNPRNIMVGRNRPRAVSKIRPIQAS